MRDRIRINGVLYESAEVDTVLGKVLGDRRDWIFEYDRYYLDRAFEHEVEITIDQEDSDKVVFDIQMYHIPWRIAELIADSIRRSCKNFTVNTDENELWGEADSEKVTEREIENLARILEDFEGFFDSGSYNGPEELGKPSSVRRYTSEDDYIPDYGDYYGKAWIRVMTYGPFTVVSRNETKDDNEGYVAVIVGNMGYTIWSPNRNEFKNVVSDLKKFIPKAIYPAGPENLLDQFYDRYLSRLNAAEIHEVPSKAGAEITILGKYYNQDHWL